MEKSESLVNERNLRVIFKFRGKAEDLKIIQRILFKNLHTR